MKNLLQNTTMAALALALAGCGTTLHGSVTEEGTSTPISGAVVQIGEESTYTDNSGFYELDVEDEEVHDVYVAAPKHEPHAARLRVGDYDERALSFELMRSDKRDQERTGAKDRGLNVNVNATSDSRDRSGAQSRDEGDRSVAASGERERVITVKPSQGNAEHFLTGKVEMTDRGELASEDCTVLTLSLDSGRTQKVYVEGRRPAALGIQSGDEVRVEGSYEQVDDQLVFKATRIVVKE